MKKNRTEQSKASRTWTTELVKLQRPRSAHHVSPGEIPEIRTLTLGQPWAWLRAGWNDLKQHAALGIGFGLMIMATYGSAIAFTLWAGLYHLAAQLTAGFVLIAPVMALGFYEISLRHEQQRDVSIFQVMRAWQTNTDGVLGIGVIMVLLFLAWFMLSMQAAAILVNSANEIIVLTGGQQTWGEFTGELLTSLSTQTALAFVLIGMVAVAVAFTFTAVSIPMLMDHPETDTITALVTSWNAVVQNWRPMLLWAILIATITGLGLAFFFIGVAITTPLLGFATWHAYRDTLGTWRRVELPKVEYY